MITANIKRELFSYRRPVLFLTSRIWVLRSDIVAYNPKYIHWKSKGRFETATTTTMVCETTM